MEPIEIIRIINFTLAALFVICYAYQFVYLAIPFLKKDKPHRPAVLHRYAVLISARNEQNVIGHLLDSINAQDYPKNLVTVFVVADNCTDNTAQVAREHGAVVYERFNHVKVGKGYALNELLGHIERDFGRVFDAFMVFDADNLLEPNYITEMNRTFSDGYEIITSYRNSKNYADNWVSSGYALWFLREAAFLNHSRHLLKTSCAVSGTGFLFSRRILEQRGGWNFFLLTEDIEFTIANVVAGERVGYCKDAVFYDEQPTTFRQSCRQRMRWARGYMQVFGAYGLKLLTGIPKRNGFACFDMAMAIMPAIVLTVVGIATNAAAAVLGFLAGQNVLIALWSATQFLVNSYLLMLFVGAVTTASEWKNIRATTAQKILYTFTFPLFMLTYIPISFAALFKRVEWKPIEHSVSVSLADMNRRAS